MFEDSELVKQVRNADPMLIDALIHALCARHDEINEKFTCLVHFVEKKRDFVEQADEFIQFMQGMKEIEIRRKNQAL